MSRAGDATRGGRRQAPPSAGGRPARPPAPPGTPRLDTPVGGVYFYSPFYRGGADRVLVPEGLSAVPPSTTSAPFRLEWPVDGEVLAMYLLGTDLSGSLGTPQEASSRLQIQIDQQGDTNFVTNGLQADFVTFATLCKFGSPWFPTNLKVKAAQTWLITIKNLSPTYTLFPEVVFAVRQGRRKNPEPPRGTKRPPVGLGPNTSPYFQGGANFIVKPQNLGPVARGTVSPQLQVQWPRDGFVTGLYLSGFDPSDATLAFEATAKLQLQLDRRGETLLVSNGQSGDFASFAALCPLSAPYFPLNMRVRGNEHWFVSLRNIDQGLPSLVPDVAFALYEKER